MYTSEEIAQTVITTMTKLSLTVLGAGIGFGCGLFFDCMDFIFSNCKQKKDNPWTIRVPTIIGAGLGFFAGSAIGPAIYNLGESAVSLVLKKS